MFSRKNLKKAGKRSLHKHYWIFVIACVIAAFIGSEYTSSLSSFTALSPEGIANHIEKAIDKVGQDGADSLGGYLKEEYIDTDETKSENSGYENKKIGSIEIGFSDGIFAGVINALASGKITTVIFRGIHSVFGSESIAVSIMVVGSILAVFLLWIFISNVYAVVLRRIMLEGHIYDKVSYNRFLYLWKTKKWIKASVCMLVLAIYQFLWSLTVVGGIIKAFSYFLTPYIVAENPDISPNDAITLSRRMMKGHKWECFVFVLSFLPWELLSIVTMGVSDVFFLNPYKQATYAEYYVYLRKLAIDAKIEGTSLLNDTYLYEKASAEKINTVYADIAKMNETDSEFEKHTGLRGFFENNLGVVAFYDDSEIAYQTKIENEIKVKDYKNVLDGLAYPQRLNNIPEKEKQKKVGYFHYMRHYSVTSIIFIFFITCFIGWIFEVAQHLVYDATFINRGFLHGPWLPIYGSGCTMILMLLYRLRKHLVAEFFVTILLCGVVEYFTGLILELTHNGQRWWDYTGYFLNISGRVCAEGLLVFGLGGVAIVYIIAPLLDNLLRKMPRKIAVTLSAILVLLFVADIIYSVIVPNSGKGITDYEITALTAKNIKGVL